MRVGNTIINLKLLRSAKMVANKDWLGIQDGYIIRCELIDGKKVDILDSDNRGFTYIGANNVLDEIDEIVEQEDKE